MEDSVEIPESSKVFGQVDLSKQCILRTDFSKRTCGYSHLDNNFFSFLFNVALTVAETRYDIKQCHTYEGVSKSLCTNMPDV